MNATTSTIKVTANVWVQYSCTTNSGIPKQTAKERARLERIRADGERRRARADEWLAEELRRIDEWGMKNAWRPHVSYEGPACGLHYWTLSFPNEENEEIPRWRTIYNRYYNKGWLGLSINAPTDAEKNAIDAFLAKIPKKYRLFEHEKNSGWQEFEETAHLHLSDKEERENSPKKNLKDLGGYDIKYMGIWLARLEDHNKLVEIMDSSPRMAYWAIIDDRRNVDRMIELLERESANYRFIKGAHGTAVMFSDPGDTPLVLVRMLASQELIPAT